jgi:ParB family chromosome partitioning protein
MNKTEKLSKMLADQAAERAARKAALPAPGPVEPRKPRPEDGREDDRATGRSYMTVSRIIPDPDQPRKEFDLEEIERKAKSFKTEGQLQPLVVEWSEEQGKWMLVDGEMRFMAAIAAGMDRVWCMFSQKKMTPAERLKKQMQANCLRTDLKPIEQANAIKRLMDLTGCTQKQVAEDLHWNESTVTRYLALIGLPPEIQADIVAGKISPRAGSVLATLDDPADQAEIAGRIVNEGLNRDDVAEAVKKKKASKRKGTQPASKIATYKSKDGKGTLTLKKPATVESTRAFLGEWLASLPDEKQAAA